MSEIKLGFVVNTQYNREGNVAQKIHLLIVRILLYYCYTHKYIQWGYHLFRSGRMDISYKKISLQIISLKPAQKLLTDLVNSITNPRSITTNGPSTEVLSWEEVLTLVLSDFSWDETSTNILFVLSASLPGDSDKIRSIVSNLRKGKQVEVIFIDINHLLSSPESLDRAELNMLLHGKASKESTRVIPTHLLSSELSHLWFRQIFKWCLSNPSTWPATSLVTFTNNNFIVLEEEEDHHDTKFLVSPIHSDCKTDNVFVSLTFKKYSSYGFCSRGYLSHRNCYFVMFDEEYQKQLVSQFPSFLVESQELEEGKEHSAMYLIKHLTSACGVMFSLSEGVGPAEIMSVSKGGEEHFDLSSFHDLEVDDVELADFVQSFRMRNNRAEMLENERLDKEIMEDLCQFHSLHVTDPPEETTTKMAQSTEVDLELDKLPARTAECATDEAMTQVSPRYCQRANVAGLVRKFQKDIKEELRSPGKLKAKHQLEKSSLIKEHKIQVVLHLIWYSEFSNMAEEEKQEANTAILALLRSLSFLTSPTEMFKFLTDQIVEEFHEDCQELLRELYEDGFLTEAPDVLCSDSNSLSSSILSTHGMAAPLYCEDSSSMSNDVASSQTSTFSRQRSWMDPCQLSQSSFSITVPKSKKKKKKQRDSFGSKSEAAKIAARIVASQKQSEQGPHQGRCRYLSAEVTPDEMKQSSKRRKLTRKNSVLDTPLKKQVKNPTTAKTSRARQRVDITPQKCTSIVQIQESPIRVGSGRASSFFGSQTQPPAARSFVIKDGFKTPNRLTKTHSSSTEDIPSVVSRSPGLPSPGLPSPGFVPPPDSNSRSQHGFTPPGTPRSGRKFIKKLSYNSPMRALFVTSTNVTSPKRKPLDNDYIHMRRSPGLDKENEPFFPTYKEFDDPKCEFKLSDALASTLEPIYNSRQREISEDAQMPTFESSPCQGTINLQTKGGFLKLLEDSSHSTFFDKKCDSDNESDVSAGSSVSGYKSILKSPFMRHNRKKTRNVSFSLDTDVQFSSDNDESTGNIFNLIDIVDGSIKNDEMLDVNNLYGCEELLDPSTSEVGASTLNELVHVDTVDSDTIDSEHTVTEEINQIETYETEINQTEINQTEINQTEINQTGANGRDNAPEDKQTDNEPEDKQTDNEPEDNHTDGQTEGIEGNMSDVFCETESSRKRKRLVSTDYDNLSNECDNLRNECD